MKLLYYTIEGFDTPNPNNHLMLTLIEDLMERGHKCHLIQSERKKVNSSYPDSLASNNNFSTSIIIRKIISKTSFIKRYLEEMFFCFKSIRYLKNNKDADMVLLQSTPTAFFHILIIKLILRKPIVYNLYDVFPGHAYDIGVIKSKGLYRILRQMQKMVYKLSNKIIVISKDMKEIIMKENVNSKKIEIVYNWIDETRMSVIDRKDNILFKKFNLDNSLFYLQYAGTLGQVVDENIIYKTAEAIQDMKGIRILLIGDGVKTDYLKRVVVEKGINNIIFLPLQPLDIIADVYNACDIGFIPLKHGVIGNGIPSKAWQLMACEKPILNVCDYSDYSQLFEKFRYGFSVTSYDVNEIANKIKYIFENKDELSEMGLKAKEYVYKEFLRKTNTNRLISIFEEVLKHEHI